MDSRHQRPKILLTLLLVATVPVLAILCRGHSPSRFDISNLPAWERQAPPPAAPAVRLAATPLFGDALEIVSCPSLESLLSQSDDTLFHALEGHPGSVIDKAHTDDPGDWLEQASALADSDPRLQGRAQAVTMRLMGDQTPDGYLGPPKAIHQFSTQDIAAHCRNMAGLLAGYSIWKNPAVLYAAIRAGHFVLDNYDPPAAASSSADESAIVYALARLYALTNDRDFLQIACREGLKPNIDGLALCQLYTATGNAEFLHRAIRNWRHGDHEPEFTATLFCLTGAPGYAASLQDSETKSVWMYRVAATKSKGVLSVNVLVPETIRTQDVSLVVKPKADDYDLVVDSAPRKALPIRILAPRTAPASRVPAPQTASASRTPQKSGSSKKERTALSLKPWEAVRVWRAGDTIVIPAPDVQHEPTVQAAPLPAKKQNKTGMATPVADQSGNAKRDGNAEKHETSLKA